MVSVFQINMFGCVSAFWVGIAVIAIGLVIQQVSLYLYKKMKHRYPQHFNPDIASSKNVLETFFEEVDTGQDTSDCNYLWALLGDGLPCAIAYNRNEITIISASLNDKQIIAREGNLIKLGIQSPNVITMVWLVRKDEVAPVYEVHIRYTDGLSKSEIKLYRLDLDVTASANYHEFRKFVETTKTLCHTHKIAIRDFIRQ